MKVQQEAQKVDIKKSSNYEKCTICEHLKEKRVKYEHLALTVVNKKHQFARFRVWM